MGRAGGERENKVGRRSTVPRGCQNNMNTGTSQLSTPSLTTKNKIHLFSLPYSQSKKGLLLYEWEGKLAIHITRVWWATEGNAFSWGIIQVVHVILTTPRSAITAASRQREAKRLANQDGDKRPRSQLLFPFWMDSSWLFVSYSSSTDQSID